jgi:hypothetical protein
MATINSLIEIDEQRCVELNAGDLLAREGEGKRVAIVGHFPFLPQLRAVARELWVIERNPQEGDFAETESARHLPQADVVGITGTAFTNHTIEGLLSLCSPRAYLIILGGTAVRLWHRCCFRHQGDRPGNGTALRQPGGDFSTD